MKRQIDTKDLVDKLASSGLLAGKSTETIQELLPLFQRLDPMLLDCMTIRDLLEVAGRTEDLPLTVVLMMMFNALRQGNLCLDLNAEHYLKDLTAPLRAKLNTSLANFRHALKRGEYAHLINATTNSSLALQTSNCPLILEASPGRELLYFQKYHHHKSHLQQQVTQLLNTPPTHPVPAKRIPEILARIYSAGGTIRTCANGPAMHKDADQWSALELSLRHPFVIISGGPGTGKTSLMVNIVRCLADAGVPTADVVLAAPTGRAAQRMTEALRKHLATIRNPSDTDQRLLNLKGSTIHHLLRYDPRRHQFQHRQGYPLKAGAIVMDEVSMVDVVIMEKFLQAVVPGHTRLILLGDKDQLPSVEAGAIFAEMIPAAEHQGLFSNHLVILQTVYRAGKKLITFAKKINQGQLPPLHPVSMKQALNIKTDQWAFVQQTSALQFEAVLDQWTHDHYLSEAGKEPSYKALIRRAGRMTDEELNGTREGRALLSRLFDCIERVRLLTIVREGPLGSHMINRAIGTRMVSACDPGAANDRLVFAGALIMITRNNYGLALFNGDVGVVLQQPRRGYRVWFQQTDAFRLISVDALPFWEPAYAMTVHKSQGSEFDDLMLVLPDDSTHPLLTREIIYTAVTRARRRVLIYGREGTLKTALAQKIERHSGLKW